MTPTEIAQKLITAQPRPVFGVTLSLPADRYTATDKGVRIAITGQQARDIDRHVRTYCTERDGNVTSSWKEVQGMNECNHGCKLYVRRRGAVLQYMLFHSASYGCNLGRDQATRDVPVSIAPKAA